MNLAEDTLFPCVGMTTNVMPLFFQAELEMNFLARSREAEQAHWGGIHTDLGSQEKEHSLLSSKGTLSQGFRGKGTRLRNRESKRVDRSTGISDLIMSSATNLSYWVAAGGSHFLTPRVKGLPLCIDFFMPPRSKELCWNELE